MTGLGAIFSEEWFGHRPSPSDQLERELLEELVITNREILRKLTHLAHQEEEEMADISGLSTDVGTLTNSVASAKTALDDLAAQVANLTAGNVSQADIDALDASVKAASGALDSAVSTDDPTPPPAPVV